MKTKAIVLSSDSAITMARLIAAELGDTTIISIHNFDDVVVVKSLSSWVCDNFDNYDALIFVGAVGIAVRAISPCVKDKYRDPAVVNVDASAQYVISLLSGHIGGANVLTTRVANILGATPIITTRSDNESLWALDTIADKFGWQLELSDSSLNTSISIFVNKGRTALFLDVRDHGTDYLERTAPSHVDIYYNYDDIKIDDYELLIVVSPLINILSDINMVLYRPRVLSLGVGCRRDCSVEGVALYINDYLKKEHISPLSVATINTIELKRDEKLLTELSSHFAWATINIFSSEELSQIETPNPSQHVEMVTGVSSVAEASAIYAADYGDLLLEKVKAVLVEGSNFTFAVAQKKSSTRGGHIEIVGAGPGDPELISVRGKNMLESADLILYAGSLVPVELTYYAKVGAVVRSSASMNLQEQFDIMKTFYDKGLLIVRLHTGDPCIYGAIQEQMSLFDECNMSYHITPGISSFQAAAAALRSQFTIPEKVQTIILTRGEGRTAMPDKEKLHLLARSESTMCIFLSATLVESVQRDLLEHYPSTTPVAVCHKLTWRDEKIVRGELSNLTSLIRDNNFTLTTMIVVGEAIDNRKGLSRLYDDEFKHIFRK